MSAFAACNVKLRASPNQAGPVFATAQPNAAVPTPAGETSFDLTVVNTQQAWYMMRRVDSANDLAYCWPYAGKAPVGSISASALPPTKLIAPNQTLKFHDLRLHKGDRFGVCIVGLKDPSTATSLASTEVSGLLALDLVMLAAFGERTTTADGDWNYQFLVDQVMEQIAYVLDMKLQYYVQKTFEDIGTHQSVDTIAGDVADVFGHLKLAASVFIEVVEILAPKLAPELVEIVVGDLVAGIGIIADTFIFLLHADQTISYWAGADVAYTEFGTGSIGYEVIAANTMDEQPPDGYIQAPTQNATVGNSVVVKGVANDDCAGVNYVNLTWTSDNWKTWHFAGQSSTAPYTFQVDLSGVADGTSVLFGWDVYDKAGNHANSPQGNRVVVKNAAALAPPLDSAAAPTGQAGADQPTYNGSTLSAQQSFSKTWAIQNTGASTWTSGYKLAFVSGTNMASTSTVSLPAAKPGQIVNVAIPMTSPGTPKLYSGYWQPMNAAGKKFGATFAVAIEVRCDSPSCGSCASTDKCLYMGCSAHAAPSTGQRFKTPSTGTAVWYGRGSAKIAFPNEPCYYLFYDSFSGTQCISDDQAALLSTPPAVCTEGAFVQEAGDPTYYQWKAGKLHTLCGPWTSASFQAYSGSTFDAAIIADSTHFPKVLAAYPFAYGQGIYPPGAGAPKCGDLGYECGIHTDGAGGLCFNTLDCGKCTWCGDGTCDAPGETCSTCSADCGPCQKLVAGAITAPPDGSVVPNTEFAIDWKPGNATDGSSTETALYCQLDGGSWSLFAGFGYTPPMTYAPQGPNHQVRCKVRTRLANDYATWTDSPELTWQTSSDYAAMKVADVQLVLPNNFWSCDGFQVSATIQNIGLQFGVWQARAYLHPVGESITSPKSIEAVSYANVDVATGQSAAPTFNFWTGVPIPLSAGSWEVTVVVTDSYGGIGQPSSLTVPAVGIDNGPPVISAFKVWGYAGTPTQVMPGALHSVQVAVTDDYLLASWDLMWRIQGGAWQTWADTTLPATSCKLSDGGWPQYALPADLPVGTLVDVRLRVRDAAGKSAEQTQTVVTISNATPQVTFLAPTGGEKYTVTTDTKASCVPVHFMLMPGNPIVSVKLGFSNFDETLSEYGPTITPTPTSGVVETCIPATVKGDGIRVFVRVGDKFNKEFKFYSNVIFVGFPPPEAPWSPMVVDSTQKMLPRPNFGTAATMMDFSGLRIAGSALVVYRNDQRWWNDSANSTWYNEGTFTRLSFDRNSLGLLNSTTVLPTTAEVGALNDPGSVRMLHPEGDTDAIDVVYASYDPTACPSPWTTACDYQLKLREVAGNVAGPSILLGSYAGQEAPGPMETGFVVTGSGAKLLKVSQWKPGIYTGFDLYKRSATSWSLLKAYPGESWTFFALGSKTWGLKWIAGTSAPQLQAFEVSETTGAETNPTTVLNFDSASDSTLIGKDPQAGKAYLVAWNSASKHLRLMRFDGSTWSALSDQTLPTTWRGKVLSFLVATKVLANNGNVFIQFAATDAATSNTFNLLAKAKADFSVALDNAFLLDSYLTGETVATPEGGLVHEEMCYWNLENRLCLQLGQPLTSACYDGNPCTTDVWDPVAGKCNYPALTCLAATDLCAGAQVCDTKTGTCVVDPATVVTCDDGNACNGKETCAVATGKCVAGTPVVIDDGLTCTVDACDPKTGAVTHAPLNDACPQAKCGVATCAPGSAGADATTGCVFAPAPVKPDGLACTTDACNPATGSATYVVTPGTCLIGGVCRANGETAKGNPCQVCEAGKSSTDWSNAAAVSCDDGLYCTVDDGCVGGNCVGAPRSCSGSGPCTAGTCDEASDACIAILAPKGSPCDDGNVCNGLESCMDGVCVSGIAPQISDGNICTTDACDPVLGVSQLPNMATCDADGDGCTVGDSCSQGGCVAGLGADCTATVGGCAIQACKSLSPWTYMCVKTSVVADSTPCDDGDACSFGDVCEQGTCVGAALNCDDGNPCSDDACTSAGTCTHVANTGTCDDGDACTQVEVCANLVCTGQSPLNCDDANSCTMDACKSGQTCSHVPSSGTCDDGDACTTGETCKSGSCGDGAAVKCDDGNPCTADACDHATGCGHVLETCDDANPCTDDVCDGSSGTCKHFSSGKCACQADGDCKDDADKCNGSPTCLNHSCVTNSATVIQCPQGFKCAADTGYCMEVHDAGTDDAVSPDVPETNNALDTVNNGEASNAPDAAKGTAAGGGQKGLLAGCSAGTRPALPAVLYLLGGLAVLAIARRRRGSRPDSIWKRPARGK